MKRLCQGLALAAFLAAPVVAFGQEAVDQDKKQTQEGPVEAEVKAEEPSGPNTGKLSLSGGVDVTTAYFFRGYNQEDQGFILEPYANIYLKAVDGESFKVTPYVGLWNSIHSENTLAATAGGPDAWYESDFLAGVDFGFNQFTVGLLYTAYTYPGGAFETIQELGAKLTWDDTDFQKGKLGFALKPYVGVYAETSDGNGSEDWYGELGVSPTVYTANKDGKYPVAISVPIVVGLGLKDYYFDDGGDEEILGYVGISGVVSVPLAFIPSDYGSWNVVGSVQYLYLAADSTQIVNHGDDWEIIGKVGIAFAY